MSGGHFFSEPENQKRVLSGDIDSMSPENRKEFLSGDIFFMSPETESEFHVQVKRRTKKRTKDTDNFVTVGGF